MKTDYLGLQFTAAFWEVGKNAPGAIYQDSLKWGIVLVYSLIIIKWAWVFFSQKYAPKNCTHPPTIRHKRINH